MSKRKNGGNIKIEMNSNNLILGAIIFVLLMVTGILPFFIKLIVGLVVGAIGLVVGLVVGIIGLIVGLAGGIVGLIVGALPVIIPVAIIYALVKNRNNGEAKRKNEDIDYV